MKRTAPPAIADRGTAAVELSIMLWTLFMLLTLAFIGGRMLLNVSIVKQGAVDADMFFANAPPVVGRYGDSMAEYAKRADFVLRREATGGRITAMNMLNPVYLCDDDGPCGGAWMPRNMGVGVNYGMDISLLPPVWDPDVSPYLIYVIFANHELDYMGEMDK